MFGSSLLVLSCLCIITIMAIYFPTIFIRKANAIIRLLEQIAANTHK
jgi:hypothetical protein